MFPERVVFTGRAGIAFTLDVVNDKKCVIVLFNLRVFLLWCSSPSPHLTKPHTDNTWEAELSWQTSLIIRCSPPPLPPSPPPLPPTLWARKSRSHGLECERGQVKGKGERGGQRGPAASFLSPRLCCLLQEHLLAGVRQQLWIPCRVLFGGGDYFH